MNVGLVLKERRMSVESVPNVGVVLTSYRVSVDVLSKWSRNHVKHPLQRRALQSKGRGGE